MFIPGTPERPAGHSQMTTDQVQIFGRTTDEDNGNGPRLGYAASSGGDVNRDGYEDVLVSAPGSGIGDAHGGNVLLFLGGEFE